MIIKYQFCNVPQSAPAGHAAEVFRINDGQSLAIMRGALAKSTRSGAIAAVQHS